MGKSPSNDRWMSRWGAAVGGRNRVEWTTDWPVSRSGFAVRRPPIYSSLIGIRDQPLDAIDRAEAEPEAMLAGDAWATFLRAVGTNPIYPFQLKPIQLDIASIAVPKGEVCFVFSGDGERLYLSDGASVTAIALPDRWKDDVPLLGPSVDRQQQELWQWKIPSGSTGKPIQQRPVDWILIQAKS